MGPFGPVGGLAITADGSWTVEIRPFFEAETVSCRDGYSGTSDDVVIIDEFVDSPGVATVTHSGPDTAGFDVIAHDGGGGGEVLLVMARPNSETTFDVPAGHANWEFITRGTWTISCG